MRTRRHKLQVSTFPFLAVLLCAMGALLLVLLVMDRRAHDAARFRAAQAARRVAEEAAQEAEARRSVIEEQRQEARAARRREREAAHARLAVQEADVQRQIEAVREELARAAERLRCERDAESVLKRQAEAEQARAGQEEQALARVRAEGSAAAAAATEQAEASRKAREEMTARLASLEQALESLKAARKKEEVTYSVVPYNGKHGDGRRPVYVECASGKVIFYPEPTPMAEPFSPAAVGAEVERRMAKQKEQAPTAQAGPYLMLLVRPDGVSTYYRFRDALRGGKVDFGYEFIDKDWVLDFPADDRDAPSQTWMAAKPSDAANTAAPPHGFPAVGIGPEGPGGPPGPGAADGVLPKGGGPAVSQSPFPAPGEPAGLSRRDKPGGSPGTGMGSPSGGNGAGTVGPATTDNTRQPVSSPPAPPSPTVAKNPPPGAARMGPARAPNDNANDEPFLRAPPSPVLLTKKHAPAPLRPARLSGDRDWILYVECKPEGVVVYPTQMLVPVAALNRPSGSNPLLQTVQQLIDHKQATVRPGEAPYRPEVRFLVWPDALRTYHRAYPTLDALAAPKTAQDLGPDDDVAAVVAGH